MNPSSLASWNAIVVGLLLPPMLWYAHGQRATQFDALQQETGAQDSPQAASLRWLEESQLLPTTITELPLPAERAFGTVSWEGMEYLEGKDDLALACRAELARWAAQGPLPMPLSKLQVTPGKDGGTWRTLIIKGRGPQAIALATLQHLLAAAGPDSGYLTDPERLELNAAGDELMVELHLRVWPTAAFLGASEEIR